MVAFPRTAIRLRSPCSFCPKLKQIIVVKHCKPSCHCSTPQKVAVHATQDQLCNSCKERPNIANINFPADTVSGESCLHCNTLTAAPKPTWQTQVFNSALIFCRAYSVFFQHIFLQKPASQKNSPPLPAIGQIYYNINIVSFLPSTGCTQPTF